MVISPEQKALYIETSKELKGHSRRLFMARVVKSLGKGGQRLAERELNWDRKTIRLGIHELETGLECYSNYSARGRKPAEAHLPNLLDDITDIVDSQSQTDPTFTTRRLYTRVSASEVRRQLILQKGYSDEELPSQETIRIKLNKLGYYPNRVEKSKPLKKIPETDAIFDEIHIVNKEADSKENILRISMDAKAGIPLGFFSQKGKESHYS